MGKIPGWGWPEGSLSVPAQLLWQALVSNRSSLRSAEVSHAFSQTYTRKGINAAYFHAIARKAALDPETAIACSEPPRRRYAVKESLKRLHLRWSDPPEARKALALALGKRPHSPFMKSFANEKNK